MWSADNLAHDGGRRSGHGSGLRESRHQAGSDGAAASGVHDCVVDGRSTGSVLWLDVVTPPDRLAPGPGTTGAGARSRVGGEREVADPPTGLLPAPVTCAGGTGGPTLLGRDRSRHGRSCSDGGTGLTRLGCGDSHGTAWIAWRRRPMSTGTRRRRTGGPWWGVEVRSGGPSFGGSYDCIQRHSDRRQFPAAGSFRRTSLRAPAGAVTVPTAGHWWSASGRGSGGAAFRRRCGAADGAEEGLCVGDPRCST